MFAVVVFLCVAASAYSATCSDYSGLSGADLRDALREDFWVGKHSQLGYSTARKYMYSYIDNRDGILTCPYTDLKMPCKYGSMSTSCNSELNCEHIVPQSFFSEAEPMKSDVHHLRPSYMNANSARSNYPFGDITASEADKWYRQREVLTSAPSASVQGEYSRLIKNTLWQPRDGSRGMVARAVGYFYTMYPKQLSNLKRTADMVEMVDWNNMEPPTAEDVLRNDLAEEYQGDRNPFVDCPELLEPAFSDYL